MTDYMNLNLSRNVRQGYDEGRTKIRISMTHELHRELGQAGIIRLKHGVHGLVAGKGGFGSGFIEMSARLLLRIISHEDMGIDTHADVAAAIRSILDDDPEQVAVARDNLHKIAELI